MLSPVVWEDNLSVEIVPRSSRYYPSIKEMFVLVVQMEKRSQKDDTDGHYVPSHMMPRGRYYVLPTGYFHQES